MLMHPFQFLYTIFWDIFGKLALATSSSLMPSPSLLSSRSRLFLLPFTRNVSMPVCSADLPLLSFFFSSLSVPLRVNLKKKLVQNFPSLFRLPYVSSVLFPSLLCSSKRLTHLLVLQLFLVSLPFLQSLVHFSVAQKN